MSQIETPEFKEFVIAYTRDYGAQLEDYERAPEVTQHIGHLVAATVSAPYKVGKDSVMVEADYPRPISDTSRLKRPAEEDGIHYHFPGYDQILGFMAAGQYVQVKAHPETKQIYGTRDIAFPSEDAFVMDVMADEAQNMREIPFARLSNTYLVVEPEQWDVRRRGRDDGLTGEALAKDEKNRLGEADRSLTVLSEDPDFIVIENADLSVAVEDLRFVVEHGEPRSLQEQVRLRNIANKMLHYVRDELGSPRVYSLS